MSVKTVSVLKTYFETGDVPTESQFGDLIDSFIHKQTGAVITAKSYDEETGIVSFSFSDSTTLSFNVNTDLTQIEQDITDLQNNKVDKIAGKGLSTNDFTNELKTKLENLTPYDPPTSHEIAFINGLQEALDLKANDNEVVKTVTYDGVQLSPDAAGNVTINPNAAYDYDLGLAEQKLNYLYFGEDVFGIYLPVPAPEVNGDYIFAHDIFINNYIKLEQRNEAFLDEDADPAITSIVLTTPLAVDLMRVIKEDNAANNITVTPNAITVSGGYVIPTPYVYVEYVKGIPATEGIGIDIIGTSAIGEGF